MLLSALVGLGWPDGWEIPAYAVGALLIALGTGLLVAGAVALGPSLTPFPAPRGTEELTTEGVYGRARHPMYGGGLLIALGWSTIFASVAGLVLTVVIALFLELKSRREEHWLDEHYPGYAEYRRRVRRRFVPFVY
ncbi:MAG TPA: PEMT/PEM2 methyltransferase family protein [Gaiellaceae bacterium]|nr:PEMT/PEM2 methyltransferase family protein [Gaiellaceae bacterium]